MYHVTQVISVKGRQRVVPAIRVCDVVLLVTGKILKVAWIHDEVWLDSRSLPEPLEIIKELSSWKSQPDVFTFIQRLPDVVPHYPYHFEWENVAVVPIESYGSWFETQVDRSVRKYIRQSQKEGIDVRLVPFGDQLVQGISSIYNEIEVRQGRKFWHYGKTLAEVKQENGTYLERSIFIGAYFGEELIGFIKLVFDGEVANMMQILSNISHFPKRPNNALLSKAIEVCESRHIKYLTYGTYTYRKKDESTLTDFKARNGFRKIEFPRYYVPLTAKGYLAVKFGLYKGLENLIPGRVRATLAHLRSKYYTRRVDNSRDLDRQRRTAK